MSCLFNEDLAQRRKERKAIKKEYTILCWYAPVVRAVLLAFYENEPTLIDSVGKVLESCKGGFGTGLPMASPVGLAVPNLYCSTGILPDSG